MRSPFVIIYRYPSNNWITVLYNNKGIWECDRHIEFNMQKWCVSFSGYVILHFNTTEAACHQRPRVLTHHILSFKTGSTVPLKCIYCVMVRKCCSPHNPPYRDNSRYHITLHDSIPVSISFNNKDTNPLKKCPCSYTTHFVTSQYILDNLQNFFNVWPLWQQLEQSNSPK